MQKFVSAQFGSNEIEEVLSPIHRIDTFASKFEKKENKEENTEGKLALHRVETFGLADTFGAANSPGGGEGPFKTLQTTINYDQMPYDKK